jgi:hypothetical protein
MYKNRVYLNLKNFLIPVKVIIDYFKQIFYAFMFFDSLIVKFGQIMRTLRLLASYLLGIKTKTLMTLIEKTIAAKLNPIGATKPKESNMCIIRPVGQ